MALRTRAATDVGGDYAAVADDGTLYWTTWDPSSSASFATTLWRQALGGAPEAIGLVPDGRYPWLSWADGSLVAVERRLSPEATRLVRLSLADPASEPVPLTDWQDRAADTWISRDGNWTAWIEPNVPSDDPNEIVVRHAGNESRLTLPGYGGRVATLTPGREAAVYQRSETARLTVVGLSSGEVLGELDAREFYGGEISDQGILAAPTAHGPWQTNDVCVLDVGARLAELAHAPSNPPPAHRAAGGLGQGMRVPRSTSRDARALHPNNRKPSADYVVLTTRLLVDGPALVNGRRFASASVAGTISRPVPRSTIPRHNSADPPAIAASPSPATVSRPPTPSPVTAPPSAASASARPARADEQGPDAIATAAASGAPEAATGSDYLHGGTRAFVRRRDPGPGSGR